MVAFYPDYMVERLEEIGTEYIHSLVIWTKNPENILFHPQLNGTLKQLNQIIILLTVTGLGGTPLEPNVPSVDQVLQQLPSIIEFLGSAQRLVIRYDPLIDVIYRDRLTCLTWISISLLTF